jgi:hypothetical protein
VLAREFFYNFKPVQKITSGLSNENIDTNKVFHLRDSDKKGETPSSEPTVQDLI